jgi:outer membrane lipoprotein carrier protein
VIFAIEPVNAGYCAGFQIYLRLIFQLHLIFCDPEKILLTMKKSILIGLLLAGCCIAGRAQNNSLGMNDPDAKKWLDALSAKIKSYKALQASFTLKAEDAKGKLQGSKNGIVYIKGSRYHISITGQEIFSDGKDVWTYDKSSNEVTITKSDPSASSISPEKFFTDFYDKDFLYKLNGESKVGERTVEEVELTPLDKKKTFFKVLLHIDKVQHTMVSIEWFDKSGDRYTLDTRKLNGNAPITDAQLAFNKTNYPGVEVVDLRN